MRLVARTSYPLWPAERSRRAERAQRLRTTSQGVCWDFESGTLGWFVKGFGAFGRLSRELVFGAERSTSLGMTDADRFEAFVRRYEDMVFATAVRLLGREAEAEDVAQAAFLKAFERFDTVGNSPAAGGWLKTVTTNLCLNHLSRYRSRWRFFSELQSRDDDHQPFEARLPAAEPADTGLDEAERNQLEQALRALPDHQRVPLVLFHFEDESYEEIARRLGASVGKIKTDIHRGRSALKQLLTGHD
jgi:RNA polymerase sigma-70 factor (ECF subfamily)